MSRKTILLEGNNLDAFTALDPFERLDILGTDNSFALGTFDEEKENLPVGLMICAEEEGRLVIEWLYTLPEYRGNGIGSELLILAFEEASARGLSEVSARISALYEEDDAAWDPEAFFVNDVFSELEEGDEEELFFGCRDIGELLADASGENKQAATRTMADRLSAFSEQELDILKAYYQETNAAAEAISPDEAFRIAQKDMSIAILDGESCSGLLLFRKLGRTWQPFAFAAADTENAEILIRAALYYCSEVVHVQDRAWIRVKRPGTRRLFDKLGINVKVYPVTFYVARVYDFLRQKELFL